MKKIKNRNQVIIIITDGAFNDLENLWEKLRQNLCFSGINVHTVAIEAEYILIQYPAK